MQMLQYYFICLEVFVMLYFMLYFKNAINIEIIKKNMLQLEMWLMNRHADMYNIPFCGKYY